MRPKLVSNDRTSGSLTNVNPMDAGRINVW
jgi:hypothetical protein